MKKKPLGLTSLEKGLILFAAVGLMACLYFLTVGLNFIEPSPQSLSGQEVGYISRMSNDVRARPHDSFSWNRASQGQRLAEGSAIYSGNDSSARFRFDNGPEITVDPATLVVIRSDERAELRLDYGTIKALMAEDQKLRVRIGNRITALTGSKGVEFSIRKNREKVEIEATGGLGKLELDGQLFEINDSSLEIDIETQVVQELENQPDIHEPVRIISPVEGEIFDFETGVHQILVEWTGPSAANYLFELVDKSSGQWIESRRVGKAFSRAMSVSKSGHYEIRISELDVEGSSLQQAKSSFEVKFPAPAMPLVEKYEEPQQKSASIISRPIQMPSREVAAVDSAPVPYVPNVSRVIEPASSLSPKSYKTQFSIGSGVNYLEFKQRGNETRVLDYATLKPLSYSLRFGMDFLNGVGFEVSHSSHPGVLKSGSAQIVNPDFEWNTQSVEGFYGFSPSWFNRSVDHFNFRVGFQRHTLPYIQLTTPVVAEVREQEVWQTSLGLDYSWLMAGRFRPQVLLRYQLPVRQGKVAEDNFNSQLNFAFDGSVGVNYLLNSRWRLGAFWYGAWQEYNYSMQNEATNSMDEGQSKYFFSNLELRLGVDF